MMEERLQRKAGLETRCSKLSSPMPVRHQSHGVACAAAAVNATALREQLPLARLVAISSKTVR